MKKYIVKVSSQVHSNTEDTFTIEARSPEEAVNRAAQQLLEDLHRGVITARVEQHIFGEILESSNPNEGSLVDEEPPILMIHPDEDPMEPWPEMESPVKRIYTAHIEDEDGA